MVMIFCIIDNHVNDLDPTMKGAARTYKKVIPIKHLQYIRLKLFEQHAFLLFLLDNWQQDLTGTLYEQTVLCFVLNNGEDAQYELADLLE